MYMTEERKKWLDEVFEGNQKKIHALDLYDDVDHEDVLRFVRGAERIVNCDIDHNSYGEFMFLTLYYKGKQFQFYGLGLHEFRKKIYLKKWKCNGIDVNEGIYRNKPDIDKEVVLLDIIERYQEAEKWEKPKQSASSSMFNELADLGDDDGAISMMEEFGL